MKASNRTAILLFLFLLTPTLAFSSSIEWKNYGEGISDARDEEKKVLVHFRTDWCTYCKKMDAITFRDQKVINYLNDNFVPIRVDGDREKKITDKYGVKGFPTSYFIDEDIERISHLPGYVDPDRFLVILKYINTNSYKSMSFKDFVESQ